MKKYKSTLLILTLLLVISLLLPACNGKDKKDGRFEYTGEPDDYGWTVEAWIDVEDGQIIDGYFDYVDENGNKKSEDEEYIQVMMEASEQNTNISEVINYLENYLENNTDVDSIDADAVSGATSTTDKFIEIAEELYKDAGLYE
ncbi:MAG: hypothetical protein GX777_04560 [Fastidiosipila sp.]|nr:hypothetical protein [Fastidiosipila sp.]